MIKILAIGNSFSQDSTTYLYNLAEKGGVRVKVVNLSIGGCSLERHWNNICENKADYDYQLNGESTGSSAGIHQVLTEDKWEKPLQGRLPYALHLWKICTGSDLV